jgi:DNA-binding NarL/FixJ family response regulator
MAVNPGVKVLIASGHSFEGEPHLLVEKGAKGFIQKPWKRAELVRMIDEVIGLTRAADDSLGSNQAIRPN